ncbi:MAG TPA: CZB domain-containing protein [Sulfuricurvum sp.]|nr:CZB domain-containing protein [Sulfuricurvum sp.]
MFKSNAYKAIANGVEEMPFGDHHSCRLGKWYETGAGKERFAHLASFKEIERPHAAVHESVHKNMVFIEGEDRSTYHKEEILTNFQTMEDASHRLFDLMNNLNKESEEDLLKNN